MDKLNKRLAVLEVQRPDSTKTVKDMSDAQLIRIITGGQAIEITDEELERIVRGEPYAPE
jgi:hypothetical protein